MALVLGAIVANRWFHTHRGLVTGIFSAANATGQLLFLPLIARTAADAGWRAAAGIVAVLALLMAGARRRVPARPALRPRPAPLRPGARAASSSRPSAPAHSPARVADRGAPQGQPAAGPSGRSCSPSGCAAGRPTASSRPTSCRPPTTTGCRRTTAAGLLAVVGIFDIAGTVALRLAHRPGRPTLAARRLLRRSRPLAARARRRARTGHRARHVGVHRLLRPGLGRHRATDGRAVPHPLRARRLRGGLRLGLRLAHGRCRRRGQRRRVGAHQPGRLPLGLGGGRRAVLRLGGDHPVDPEGPRGGTASCSW